MVAVVTRVKEARVEIQNEITGAIGTGLLVLLGISETDTAREADYMADRLTGLRIFEDANGKMNLSPKEANGEFLIVSQFTLLGDVRSRRPSFTKAARPEQAILLYEKVIEKCRGLGFSVQTGVFGADMQVFSQNDGPVTILVHSDSLNYSTNRR